MIGMQHTSGWDLTYVEHLDQAALLRQDPNASTV
jgi:hypothetical protein